MTIAGIYRIISFFPYVVPAIVIGIIWPRCTTRPTVC